MNRQASQSVFSELLRYIRVVMLFGAIVFLSLIAAHFPWDVDAQSDVRSTASDPDLKIANSYYDNVYAPPVPSSGSTPQIDSEYVEFNQLATHQVGIEQLVTEFVRDYHLQDSKVLEVGAGSGTLQDIVEDYTGLDIAAQAARYFHKPFVQGSATDLPFDDNTFDSVWTVWTIEHVPNPERAFLELRRVVRNGGMIYLCPTWNVPTWVPQGLQVRPYQDLDLGQKLVKATISLRNTDAFVKSYRIPIRSLRWISWKLTEGPTRLRYTRLQPNYETYWSADSDAINSLDSYEALLWFRSRGDDCLNCASLVSEITLPHFEALIIKVNKT